MVIDIEGGYILSNVTADKNVYVYNDDDIIILKVRISNKVHTFTTT